MQGKEIPDALATRALCMSNTGGVEGISRVKVVPCPGSIGLILTSPPEAASLLLSSV